MVQSNSAKDGRVHGGATCQNLKNLPNRLKKRQSSAAKMVAHALEQVALPLSQPIMTESK